MLQKILINLDVFIAFYKVAPMLAILVTLYLTLFVVETNSWLGTSLPTFNDPPKQNELVEKSLKHQDIYFGGWSLCEKHANQENVVFTNVSQLLSLIK